MDKEMNLKFKDAPAPGKLGLPELYAISLGYVIGAGIVTTVGPAMAITGRSAWLAYFVAILFGLLVNIPSIFVTSTIRLGGGPYSMLAGLAGKKIAGIYSILFLALLVQMAAFGMAMGLYVNALWPNIPVKWAGIATLTFFYIVNMFGIDIMAKVQKIMTWLLIGTFLVFIILGLPKMTYPVFNFSSPEFLTNGVNGFIAAIFLFVASTNGYLMSMSYGKDSKNAKRDIPKAILLCVPSFIIIYCGVSLVQAGIIPLEGAGKTTLVQVASKILNPTLFALFMIGGPFMAITSTMNSAMANNTIPIAQSCRDGWLPKSLATQNKYGIHYKILTLIYMFGVIPLLFELSIVQIIMIINLALSAQSFLYTIAYLKMPEKYPESWQNSKFHVPNGVYKTIVILSFLGWFAIFVNSVLKVPTPVLIMAIIFFAFSIVFGLFKSKSPNIKIEVSMWEE